MPEARDRLERPVNYSAAFLNRRSNGVLLDEPSEPGGVGSIGQEFMMGRGGLVRGNFGIRRGQTQFRTRQGRENMTTLGVARRGRGRSSTLVLPSWYPRTSLRSISVLRAIEKRRAHMGEGVSRDIETPTPQQHGILDSLVPLSGDHNYSKVTPGPSVGIKRPRSPSTTKVQQLLLDITSENTGEEDAPTPQKRLLNSIDKVEKIVMQEIQKMKSTPSAKKAEREKRVHTLMSMR